ncbi:hypothetical protein RJ639_032660 [Escallonia herrerae]|uniref:Retrotransposon Copia-like N-terminal domain-containing protein n=1 Tax=Escallonia herrerae TaxID=1293975 RepID=A0AA89BAA6_9ASTE|nr:hypothetical protein RJ639_032660 [Escallonia herrerae]
MARLAAIHTSSMRPSCSFDSLNFMGDDHTVETTRGHHSLPSGVNLISASLRLSRLSTQEKILYVHGGLAPVTNVQNIAIDTKSPFYLHPSDHPGLIFVTQPLSENGENYFTWRRNMLTALQSKNKAGFVDRLIAKPDVHSRDFQSWIQCNAVVKSWIINSLSRELQTGAAHADTASEIWCDFDERFTQGIALRVYDLK